MKNLTIKTLMLLALALTFAVTGCKKSDGTDGGDGNVTEEAGADAE